MRFLTQKGAAAEAAAQKAEEEAALKALDASLDIEMTTSYFNAYGSKLVEEYPHLAKKIDDAIKAVGQEGGYVYIFDLNATQIPFVNETLSTDVTGAVKAKLGL